MQCSRPLPSFRRKKPSGAAVRLDEGLVALVDVRGDQLGDSASVRAMTSVGTPMTSAASRAAIRLRIWACGRDQHLAAEMAALLFRGQLVLEVDAGAPASI
jgi:hypothetical protein